MSPRGEGQLGKRRGKYRPRWPLTEDELKAVNSLRGELEPHIRAAADAVLQPVAEVWREVESRAMALALWGGAVARITLRHKWESGGRLTAEDHELVSGWASDVRRAARVLSIDPEPFERSADELVARFGGSPV